ncbi:hypothetical protein VNO78_18500 [Psophocarpus tetragonolobus]|uniref:VQ domain-containing protein n=1 Tax=Psophocarpus tetragonolobus TaxID=3891 RepID=A0AAN9XLK6_PSOTE
MGKLQYDPNCYTQKDSINILKTIHNTTKKTVKITYISSPVLVRTCHVSEFRSVVQQLTGKHSNNKVQNPHNKGYSTLMHQRVMQLATQDGNSCYHYNRSMMTAPLEFDEDYFFKQLASSVLPSPYIMHV